MDCARSRHMLPASSNVPRNTPTVPAARKRNRRYSIGSRLFLYAERADGVADIRLDAAPCGSARADCYCASDAHQVAPRLRAPWASTNLWYRRDMARNTSISLDDHFSDFLSREVSSGRYRSASEVVRAGLRLLEDRETQLAALRAGLAAGEESGTPEPFDFDAFIAAKKA